MTFRAPPCIYKDAVRTAQWTHQISVK